VLIVEGDRSSADLANWKQSLTPEIVIGQMSSG